MSSDSRLSPDRHHWWDGSEWHPASEDRTWWWDGSHWNAIAPGAGLEPRSADAASSADAAKETDRAEPAPDQLGVAPPYEMVIDAATRDTAEPNLASPPSTAEDLSLVAERSNEPNTTARPESTTMPGATGNVRELANGAIVSGNGYFYWSGWKWRPLVPNPPVKAPGNYSRERLGELPKLVRGKSIRAMGDAGAELSRLVSEHGSLKAAEERLYLMPESPLGTEGSTPPEDAIRSPDGTQWWDGKAWKTVSIPATAVRSPDGASWWDGSKWQPVSNQISRSVETSQGAIAKAKPAVRNQVRVKSYKNERDFEHDATRMMRDGWEIQGQSSRSGHVSIAKTLIKTNLTLGLGALTGFSRTKDKITVTWVR